MCSTCAATYFDFIFVLLLEMYLRVIYVIKFYLLTYIGLAESNGSLLPGLWCNSLHVTCGLTACTPGSAPGPTLGNEYGKTLPYLFYLY